MSKKRRLDLHLVEKGLVASRHQAQQLIRGGKVRDANGQLLDKPGQEVLEDLEIDIKLSPRFVSRGGKKLLGALKAFPIDVTGKICIDGGISTGGFTDCLLQHGASKVYGIDVGYGQLAWNLRNDARVVVKERTNLRNLQTHELYGPEDEWSTFAVADLSFISLRLIIPSLTGLLVPEKSQCLLLIKPQFEVGKGRVGKGGVVRDSNLHIEAIENVIEISRINGWDPLGLIPSPITGPAGNHEYLLWLGKGLVSDFPVIEKLVIDTLKLKC